MYAQGLGRLGNPFDFPRLEDVGGGRVDIFYNPSEVARGVALETVGDFGEFPRIETNPAGGFTFWWSPGQRYDFDPASWNAPDQGISMLWPLLPPRFRPVEAARDQADEVEYDPYNPCDPGHPRGGRPWESLALIYGDTGEPVTPPYYVTAAGELCQEGRAPDRGYFAGQPAFSDWDTQVPTPGDPDAADPELELYALGTMGRPFRPYSDPRSRYYGFPVVANANTGTPYDPPEPELPEPEPSPEDPVVPPPIIPWEPPEPELPEPELPEPELPEPELPPILPPTSGGGGGGGGPMPDVDPLPYPPPLPPGNGGGGGGGGGPELPPARTGLPWWVVAGLAVLALRGKR